MEVMTFREKYHEDFKKDVIVNPAESMCPSSYDYEKEWDCDSTDMSCDECWDRQMPETKILFLCDGNVEKCRYSPTCYKNCSEKDLKSACRHTSDVNHAKNFKKLDCNNGKRFEEKTGDYSLNLATSPLLKEAGFPVIGEWR